MGSVRIEELGGAGSLPSLSSEWGELQRHAVFPTPFFQPEYLKLWADTLGKQFEPRILTARSAGKLVGIAPLMELEDPLGPLSVSTVRFLGNNIGYQGDVLYADILASEPRSEVVAAILEHVKATWRAQRWDLGYLHPSSPACAIARRILRLDDSAPGADVSKPVVTLDLPLDWGAYLRSLSANTRGNFRRRLRRLEGKGRVAVAVDREPTACSRRIGELIRNHERWWKGSRKEAWFGDEAVHRFLADSAALLASKGQYRVFRLELDGTAIAWSAGAFDGARYLEQVVSHDREFAADSPGMVLSILFVRELLEAHVSRVVLGPGFDERKRALGGTSTEFIRVQGYPGWLRGVARLRTAWSRRRASR